MSHLSYIAPLTLLLIAAAYLLGSLSGQRLLAWLPAPVEPDAGQPGGPARRGPMLARIAFDAGKVALATWMALRLAPVGDPLSVTAHGYLAALAAVLGHVWPLWHRFRGGGPATALVGALAVLWPAGVAAWLVAGLVAWLLSGYAGLSILLGAVCLPLLAWWGGADPPRLWFAMGAFALLVLAQREHLRRLWAGTEPQFARARRLYRWRRG